MGRCYWEKPMVIYEVRVQLQEALVSSFQSYMSEKHLPEIFATGCFHAIRFERAEDGTFRSRYEADSTADLARYLQGHAAHFRADFLEHFPEGCQVSREVLETLKEFP